MYSSKKGLQLERQVLMIQRTFRSARGNISIVRRMVRMVDGRVPSDGSHDAKLNDDEEEKHGDGEAKQCT
jgi:hypothetical protein